jgi:hypothetical protein
MLHKKLPNGATSLFQMVHFKLKTTFAALKLCQAIRGMFELH